MTQAFDRPDGPEGHDPDMHSEVNSLEHGNVMSLIDGLWEESTVGEISSGQPYYHAPDGTEPIPDAIWQRLNVEAVEATFDLLRAEFGGNGHLRPDAIFDIPPEEREALANVGGSDVVRQVTGLLGDVDLTTTLRDTSET